MATPACPAPAPHGVGSARGSVASGLRPQPDAITRSATSPPRRRPSPAVPFAPPVPYFSAVPSPTPVPGPPQPNSLAVAQAARDAGRLRLEAAHLRLASLQSRADGGGGARPAPSVLAREARKAARRESELAGLEAAVARASHSLAVDAFRVPSPEAAHGSTRAPAPRPAPFARSPAPNAAPPPHSRRSVPFSPKQLRARAEARSLTLRAHRGLPVGVTPATTGGAAAASGGGPATGPPTLAPPLLPQVAALAPPFLAAAGSRGGRAGGAEAAAVPAAAEATAAASRAAPLVNPRLPRTWLRVRRRRKRAAAALGALGAHALSSARRRAAAFSDLCAISCAARRAALPAPPHSLAAVVREAPAAAAASALAPAASPSTAAAAAPPPQPLVVAASAASAVAPAATPAPPSGAAAALFAAASTTAAVTAAAAAAPPLAVALATLTPQVCLVEALLRFLPRRARCSLGATCWAIGAAAADRAVTVLVALVRTTLSRMALVHSVSFSLPRAPAPRGLSRESSVVAAESQAARLCPSLAHCICFLAADLKRGSGRERGCRVVVASVSADSPPPPPPGWSWVPTVALRRHPDGFLADCGVAASLSLAPTVTPLPRPCSEPPQPRLPPALPPAPLPAADVALAGMHGVAARLRAALQLGSPYARSWIDAVGGVDVACWRAASPALRVRGSHVSGDHLRLLPLPERHVAPSTRPYPFPRNGVPPPWFRPKSIRDLWRPCAWRRASLWWRSVWPFLVDCNRLGPTAKRGRIETVVFVQADLVPEARGVVWDCRGERPVPANWGADIHSHWDTAFLESALVEFPDKELVSFVTRGAATSSDAAGLTMVLGPHLTSLAAGFAEASANVDEFCDLGWFEAVRERAFPFVPCRSCPKGTVTKSTGKIRTTSDGGCPRSETNPPAMSLNEATRASHRVPEVKPTNGDVAKAMAVLRYAADLFGEDLIVLSDDFKCYFNQFRTHPSEWFKAAFFWLEVTLGTPVPVWIVEYVLGFGLTASSGIAQRFSHALLWILARRFDAEEAANPELDPARAQYLKERAALGDFQAALFVLLCYTDDVIFIIVGVARAMRLLEAWGKLIAEVNLLMAGEGKRQLGSCVKWNGVFHNAFLCNQVIPEDKVVRARRVAATALAHGPMPFREYRSATGLLGHLKCVLRWRKVSMYGLFLPFRGGGKNPEGLVRWSPPVLEQLSRWDVALRGAPGASCADPPGARRLFGLPCISGGCR